MDRLEAMAIFVAVAERRSFSAAADARGLSRPSVSRAVASLEDAVGAQLLIRTTRRVSLSRVGERYLDDCRRILEAVAEADDSARGASVDPSGLLVLTAPVLFGRLHALPMLQRFLTAYPEVRARVLLLDRVTDLIEEGIDVAIRIGALPDSSQRAIRVGEVSRVCVVAPGYLARSGPLASLDDLPDHILVSHSHRPHWRLRGGKHPVEARIRVNDAQAAVDLAVRGFGITQVLSYQSGPAVARGELVRVLTGHEPEPLPVHLVTPPGRTTARTRAFLDHAAVALREVAQGGWQAS
jgi:DNA-binding transcriptional LysR family regulator